MTETKLECVCQECGQSANPTAPQGEMWRCSACGGQQRKSSLEVHDHLLLRENARGKVKTPGSKRPRIEFVEGDDLHRDSGRWMRLSRQIDRENDRYHEKVLDPKTGRLVHECDEPLSRHGNHGSAKGKE